MSRYPAPELKDLPEDMRARILEVQEKAGFVPNVFLALARRYGCVPVHTDSEKFPAIADAEADFAYLRLMRGQSDVPTGYTPDAIAQWADGVRAWTHGDRPRDVFVYFINGAKERAPAGAMELLRQLGATPSHAA